VKVSGLIVVSGLIAVAVMLAAETSVAGQAWPDRAYRLQWEVAHIPEEVATSTVVAVPVAVRNTGDRTWPASQVFVSYHWLRDEQLVVWDGKRTSLARDLRAGNRTEVSVHVATPAEPGSYVLMLTLVHELVAWFEHKGATPIVRPVTVRSPVHAACGVSGSMPCPAAQ
jgi:urease beta subunit